MNNDNTWPGILTNAFCEHRNVNAYDHSLYKNKTVSINLIPHSSDFDPWEISKDGLEELMQKQKDDPIPAPQPIPVSYPEQQLPAPTQQPPPQQFHLPQNYQVIKI